jgi:hypothetical protein
VPPDSSVCAIATQSLTKAVSWASAAVQISPSRWKFGMKPPPTLVAKFSRAAVTLRPWASTSGGTARIFSAL